MAIEPFEQGRGQCLRRLLRAQQMHAIEIVIVVDDAPIKEADAEVELTGEALNLVLCLVLQEGPQIRLIPKEKLPGLVALKQPFLTIGIIRADVSVFGKIRSEVKGQGVVRRGQGQIEESQVADGISHLLHPS